MNRNSFLYLVIILSVCSCAPTHDNIINQDGSQLIYTIGQTINDPLNATGGFIHTIVGTQYGYSRYVGINFPTSMSRTSELRDGPLQVEIDKIMPIPHNPQNGAVFKEFVDWYSIVPGSLIKPDTWTMQLVSGHIKRKVFTKTESDFTFLENADIILNINFPTTISEGDYVVSFDLKNEYDDQLPIFNIKFVVKVFNDSVDPIPSIHPLPIIDPIVNPTIDPIVFPLTMFK